MSNAERFASVETDEPRDFPLESFVPKIRLEINVGKFVLKTASDSRELRQAFALRFQVFQVESMGLENGDYLDHDAFDTLADHLLIIDQKSNQVIATCRLNCSLFTSNFYSEQEFLCRSLLEKPGTKLEVGRVCVHREYRKGAIIMLLWRALAEYMKQTDAKILFGCGSVLTEDPNQAYLIYRYLLQHGKVQAQNQILPTTQYKFNELNQLLLKKGESRLTHEEMNLAESLLPPLCKSYLDIGCYVPGPPAIDRSFQCIDFLTVLEIDRLDSKIRRKMFGT